MAFVVETAPHFTDFAAASCTIGGVAVSANFHNASTDSLMAAGTQPYLMVASGVVASTARGTAVVVNGTSYTVAKVEPDGTGVSRVLLEKV